MLTMTKVNQMINEEDKKYAEMISKVNIADFTKCMAIYSDMSLTRLKDEVIFDYLITWAKNKYRFYEMLGNKLVVDTPFLFQDDRDVKDLISDMKKKYPQYYSWLEGIQYIKENRFTLDKFESTARYAIKDLFRREYLDFEGMKITHFFKKKLNASDEFITELGKIYENRIINAKYSVSIDPVDIMTSSENPYGWNSCYRLEQYDCDLHGDGCLAAVLDDSSLVTYLWDREGKLDLYETYELKKVRYKRIRMTISISPSFNSIHFNTTYPKKEYEDNEVGKKMRDIVETRVANFLNIENKWRKKENSRCERMYQYGYGEYNRFKIYGLSAIDEEEKWSVFNCGIKCPCGCGQIMPGSDDEGIEYCGNGYICTGYQTQYYCDLCDEYCSRECCEDECCDCSYWQQEHPTCDLDNCECEYTSSERYDAGIEVRDDGRIYSCEGCCENCQRWKEYNESDEEEDYE